MHWHISETRFEVLLQCNLRQPVCCTGVLTYPLASAGDSTEVVVTDASRASTRELSGSETPSPSALPIRTRASQSRLVIRAIDLVNLVVYWLHDFWIGLAPR